MGLTGSDKIPGRAACYDYHGHIKCIYENIDDTLH